MKASLSNGISGFVGFKKEREEEGEKCCVTVCLIYFILQ